MSESQKKGFLDRIMSEADDSAHPFLEKVQEHIRTIVLVVGTILFVVAAYSLYNLWQDRKITQANSQLESIMTEQDPEERLSMLSGFFSQAPDRLKGAIILEKARTNMDLENYEQAALAFEQLGRISRSMNPVSILGMAKAFEMMNNHEQAVNVLKSNPLPDEFKSQYLVLLSFNAERAGDYSTALDAYQRLKQEAQGADVGFIEYKIEVLSRLNQPD